MIHWTRQFLIAALLLLVSTGARAANWTEPAAALARDIASVTGTVTMSLTVRNASLLGDNDKSEITRAISSELRSGGIRLVQVGAGAADVTVTLSENVQGYLWVAEVRQGNENKVVMRAVPRMQPAATAPTQSRVTLRQALLHSQPEPILDAAIIDAAQNVAQPAVGHSSNARLAVLEPGKVSLYRFNAGHWEAEQSFPITHSRPWPRDLRGRIVPAREHLFDAYLPGVICTSTATAPISMTCRDEDDPWPLLPSGGAQLQSAFYGAARNFFTGALSPGIGKQTTVAPFYSAAALPRTGYTLWLLAGTDGKLRQTDGVNERVLAGDWGSDIAAINTTCGSMVLATGNGDDTAADSLRAYEFADREPQAASTALGFNGPLTALWTSLDGGSAMAVAHNLKTNAYELFTITASCSQ